VCHTHTHTPARTHARTHTHTHTCAIFTHTHTHTHTPAPSSHPYTVACRERCPRSLSFCFFEVVTALLHARNSDRCTALGRKIAVFALCRVGRLRHRRGRSPVHGTLHGRRLLARVTVGSCVEVNMTHAGRAHGVRDLAAKLAARRQWEGVGDSAAPAAQPTPGKDTPAKATASPPTKSAPAASAPGAVPPSDDLASKLASRQSARTPLQTHDTQAVG